MAFVSEKIALLGGALLIALACTDSASDAEGPAASAGSGNGGAGGGGSSQAGTGGSAKGGSGDSKGGTGGSPSSAGGAGEGGTSNGWLRDRYPADDGIAADEAVLFHDDFEAGWGRWTAPAEDTTYLHLETGATAHAGSGYLRSTVTEADLEQTEYISSSTRFDFPRRVDRIYWRFHARFPVVAPNPHHWIRMAAGNEAYDSSGLANTVPLGDEGFWFDFDANVEDVFNFYVYWHAMRSGRCNDGSATPGCDGDQGSTYFYGNGFRPLNQSAFPRDQWFCIEIEAVANAVGEFDGSLAFFIDDQPVGAFGPGYPDGTWLRDSFHEGGCEFSACTPPQPFEGFDFRTSADVAFKGFFMDAYYERETAASRRAEMEALGLTVSDEQTILYDDIVVATERIGCRLD